jgi:hypothetical protein
MPSACFAIMAASETASDRFWPLSVNFTKRMALVIKSLMPNFSCVVNLKVKHSHYEYQTLIIFEAVPTRFAIYILSSGSMPFHF